MADDNDVERSYPATPRRLEQARERGQVARSRELSTAAIALTAAIAVAGLGPALYQRSAKLLHDGLSLDRNAAFDPEQMLVGLHTWSVEMMMNVMPMLALLLGATLAAPLLLSGWIFSTQSLAPDFGRLDPRRGLKNMISAQSLAELLKAVAKCVLLGGIGGWSVMHSWGEMQYLSMRDASSAASQLGSICTSGFFALVGGLILIALIDVPLQLWRYYHGLRMTREEVRQEQRESEGDPQLKARIRSAQRAIARKRMMSAVPKASVIVTNPTHYAIALEYHEGTMRAPRLVAKGINLVALRIREIGQEHNVAIVEAPPLARALYRHTEIGQEIPQALYTVVAQVLAYVFQVQRSRSFGGPTPQLPTVLDVPPELDPLAGGAAA